MTKSAPKRINFCQAASSLNIAQAALDRAHFFRWTRQSLRECRARRFKP